MINMILPIYIVAIQAKNIVKQIMLHLPQRVET